MKQNNGEINEYRKHEMYGQPMRSTGNNGVFKVPYKQHYLNCVVSDGERDGFEHVSVSCQFKLRGLAELEQGEMGSVYAARLFPFVVEEYLANWRPLDLLAISGEAGHRQPKPIYL